MVLFQTNMLTPERIAQFDALTGFRTPTTTAETSAKARANEIRAKYTTSTEDVEGVPTPSGPFGGFASRLQQSVEKSAQERAAKLKEISESQGKGEQGFVRSAAQVGGQLVGGALIDPVMNVLAAISPKIPEKLGEIIKGAEEGMSKPVSEGGGLLGDLTTWLSNREDFQQLAMDPTLSEPLKRDVEAINNYLALFGTTKAPRQALTTGIEKGLQGTEAVIRGGGGAAGALIKETGNIASDIGNLAKMTGQKFSEVLPDKTKMRSYFTNIDEQVFKRVEDPVYAQKVKDTLATLETGTKNPYLELAQNVSDRITSLSDDAKATFSETAKAYVAKGERFDVGARIKEILDSVDSFKTGKDIAYKEIRGRDGTIEGWRLEKGRYSPFSNNEVSLLNRLIDDIRSAKDITADQLLALDQKFATYYRAVPDSAGATPYHAAIMELKAQTQERIRSMLTGDLKDAYTKYANVSDLKADFGNKIVGPDGVVKDTAESFLSNLGSMNKGAMQTKIKNYSKALEMDLIAETQVINDAKKFMLTQAPTGGRMKDFMISYGFGGAGAGLGAVVAGPVGGAIGAAAGAGLGTKLTSPKFVGARALDESIAGSTPKTSFEPKSMVGQKIKEVSEIPNKQGGFIKNPFAEKASDLSSSIQKAKASGQSFDEWVRGREYFRGGNPEGNIQGQGGIYLTSSREGASTFGKEITEQIIDVPKDSILDVRKISSGKETMRKLLQDSGLDPSVDYFSSLPPKFSSVEAKRKFIEYVKNNTNYKAVHFDDVDFGRRTAIDSLVVFDKSALKTRSQLKAEWDAVIGKTPDSVKSWLKDWVGGGDIEGTTLRNPPKEVIEFLDKPEYKPTKSVTVYKGVPKEGEVSSKGYQSWTTDKDVALAFAEGRYNSNKVISKKVLPDEVLVELSKLPDELKSMLDQFTGGLPEWEIILKPQ